MCTIVILRGVSREHPVVIAANRDEYYSRATREPGWIDGAGAVAGLDLEKGGSWMGVTPGGFFVGLTNQRTFGAPHADRRSRGEVVLECLRLGDRAAARDYLSSLDGAAYNSFNLLTGDASGLDVTYVRDAAVSLAEVPPGVSVLPNDVLDSLEFPKARRARELVGDDVGELPWPALRDRLHRILGDHEKPPLGQARGAAPAELIRELGALCVHTPVYGTRSFTAVALDEGAVAHYAFAAGPTCESRPDEITGLLYSDR